MMRIFGMLLLLLPLTTSAQIPHTTPLNQFACLSKRWWAGTQTYTNTVLRHSYFVESLRPEPVVSGMVPYVCHDSFSHGEQDHASYTRLAEKQVFNLWSSDQPLFFDLDSNGILDIEDNIRADLLPATIPATNLFYPLSLSGGEFLEQIGNAASISRLGYVLRPFIDPSTSLAYCPTTVHYESMNRLMNAIGKNIGVSTEAVYLAKRETLTDTTDGGMRCLPDDILLVSESDVKRVWFSYINGVATPPWTDAGVRGKTMRFHYPFNFANPLIKQHRQNTYTIVTPSQIQGQDYVCDNPRDGGRPEVWNQELPTSFPMHDKRIGCAPSLAD